MQWAEITDGVKLHYNTEWQHSYTSSYSFFLYSGQQGPVSYTFTAETCTLWAPAAQNINTEIWLLCSSQSFVVMLLLFFFFFLSFWSS